MFKNFWKLPIIISVFLAALSIGVPLYYGIRHDWPQRASLPKDAAGSRKADLNDLPFKRVLLIGWDGVQRDHLLELMKEGKLPNLQQLISEGAFVPLEVTTGDTVTKPGWAEILTGYGPAKTGVSGNRDYKPIPRGYTIHERLENYFGDENIITVFLAGKGHNLGTRGPHRICENCLKSWEVEPFGEEIGWPEKALGKPVPSGEVIKFKQMEGEPYYLAHTAIDVFENLLGPAANVGPKTIKHIERFSDRPLFLFAQFEEPDRPGGHGFGENSPEYSRDVMLDDEWLGRIVGKLKELGIYDDTLIYVTTDHGFDEGDVWHFNAPHIFLATNDASVRAQSGDRKDITPTILERYGIDVHALTPVLDGVSLLAQSALLEAVKAARESVRIGYFHGVRTTLFYRAYINDEFDANNVPLVLYTKNLREEAFSKITKTDKTLETITYGKVGGEDLINEVVKGSFVGVTSGASSFIDSAVQNLPVVAVAELGHNPTGQTGNALLLRKGLVVDKPSDLKGKIIATRRGGDGDDVFLREFLTMNGLDPDRDVRIIDNVADDDFDLYLKNGKIDGGFYHILQVERLVKDGYAYIYRKFDWVNPELAQALLVFHKDFVKNHPDQVERIIRVYMKRIKYELGLPEYERLREQKKSLQLEKDFRGMNLPQYAFPPRVRLELLDTMQDLLFKYGYIDHRVDLAQFIDNSFVDKIYEELKEN